MQQGLTSDEVELLLSLSDSELEEFFSSISPDRINEICAVLSAPSSLSRIQSGNYSSSQSARVAAIQNLKTAAGQEVGPLPPVADPQRRKRCAADNLLFAETYFAATFYLGWAPYQRTMMDRFQDVILSGGRECAAVRRGGLKSTCARVSAIWCAVNGHRRFPVLVGATDHKANEHRENFLNLLESSTLLLDDYPELLPLVMKKRQPKKSFRLDGRLLTLHPNDDRGRIVFPDIHDAPCCQVHVAPYSIEATDVSGLSYVDRFGVTIRPDCLIFDDVQTPQSAGSPGMTGKREDAVNKTFCGLAGLGEKIAAIMVCTVREHDDLSERFLSRKKNPNWNGKKYPSLIKMPERMDLWEQYTKVLVSGSTAEAGKQNATELYRQNQAAMDEGGVVAWDKDKLPDELSALQSLMTIRALDPGFFRCEIQQESEVAVNTSGVRLDSGVLLKRLSMLERGIVPASAGYLTAFIDSQDEVLFWMVCAWQKDFTGWIVDYGGFPDQGRPIFYKSALSSRISELLDGVSWEECFVHAHNLLEELILNHNWMNERGEPRQVDILLKDWSDGQHKPRIESQVKASRHKNRCRPSKGFAPKPGKKPLHLWGDAEKDRHNGNEWVERRSESPIHVQYNTNVWKSHAARRLLTTVGAPSAVMLPGRDESENKMLAEHFTAEQPKSITYDGATGTAWELVPGRDNDFWDCFVGCNVGASMLACGIGGEAQPVNQRRVMQLPGGVKRV